MGGRVITNSTLQITREQGFPAELDIKAHLTNPIAPENLKGRLFTFTKPELRFFQPHGIRVFLVENVNGKFIYWGMVFIHTITLDYKANTTSGTFEVIEVFSPARMKEAFLICDGKPELDYFQ